MDQVWTVQQFEVVPCGDPVVMSKEVSNFIDKDIDEVHDGAALMDWAESADAVRPVKIQNTTVAPTASSNEPESLTHQQSVEHSALEVNKEKSKVYLSHSFVTSEVPITHHPGHPRYRKSLIFIARDRSAEDYKRFEGAVEISIVEVLENPSHWVKGELRPAVGTPKANRQCKL